MSFKKWLGSNTEKDPIPSRTSQFSQPSVSSGASSSISKISEQGYSQTSDGWILAQESSSELAPLPLDPDLPYGDGCQKVFGMENFGNTCYCNSIVQCLYYTKDFRISVLKYPPRDVSIPKERRSVMPGNKPHPAQVEQLSHQAQQQAEADKDDSKSKMSLGRRTSSFFGRKKNSADEDSEKEQVANHAANPPTIPIANNHQGSVITIPNIRLKHSLVIVGKTDDSNATVDARKKAALMNEPLVNLDHSLTPAEPKDSLFMSLKDLFESVTEHESKTGVVSPSYFVDTLKRENELFRSAMHQDAHEFLNFLLNETIDTLNRLLGVKKNAVHRLFEGLLTNQTKCLTCENITSRDETFLDLSLDLGDSDTLESCLKQFSASEMLTGSNKFYCDSCHSLQEAEKKMGIRKLPKVLALHLKRFEYSEEQNRMVKLFDKIKYPSSFKLQSDIPPETPEERLKFYELYAVVVHIGGGPHHGHYVALVKTEDQGWLLFDDETVEKIDESFVLRFVGDSPDSATAYILFYQEITEKKFDEAQQRITMTTATLDGITSIPTTSEVPSVQLASSSTQGFNSAFNLNMKSIPSKCDEAASVSPLDKITKVKSNDASFNSSQNDSTASSSNRRLASDGCKQSIPSKGNIMDLKSSNSAVPLSASPPHSSSSPFAEKSGVASFWKREPRADKSLDDKKKKNRISMSFGFGKRNQ
jgi:ubiquitin carboxyl-terminal hydrolase 9/13